MITTTIQAIIVLAIESYVFARFSMAIQPNHPRTQLSKTIPTYLTLFIFGFLYQLVLVYDSLRLKNTIQVIGLCIYNMGMLIYAAIQTDQIHKAVTGLTGDGHILATDMVWNNISPFLIAVPCIIAFFTLVMGFIAWKLYDEFAWTIYKHISADLRMKRRFLTFQVWPLLLLLANSANITRSTLLS